MVRDEKLQNMVAVCLTEFIAVYTVDLAKGTLSKIFKRRADFSGVDASLNHCAIREGIIATGGDDCKVRVIRTSKNYEAVEKTDEFEAA
jgi:hypothetical protein